MFAVMKTGGKQYKVQSGDTLRVEKLAANAGDKVQFNEVLMIGGDKPQVGSPVVAGAGVQAEEQWVQFVTKVPPSISARLTNEL